MGINGELTGETQQKSPSLGKEDHILASGAAGLLALPILLLFFLFAVWVSTGKGSGGGALVHRLNHTTNILIDRMLKRLHLRTGEASQKRTKEEKRRLPTPRFRL